MAAKSRHQQAIERRIEVLEEELSRFEAQRKGLDEAMVRLEERRGVLLEVLKHADQLVNEKGTNDATAD